MLTSKFLKDIKSEASPIIERMLDDADLIAGLRDVFTAQGGDWGALKALIKAEVQDERDETGDGKRVRKILDKASSSSAYAAMLGMANMNEENSFADDEGFDPSTGEITEPQPTPQVGQGSDVAAEPVASRTIQPETANEIESGERAVTGIGPASTGAIPGRELPKDASDAALTAINAGSSNGRTTAFEAANAGSTPAPASNLTAFTPKPLRPYCLNPGKCAGMGKKHCWACEKAHAEQQGAA